MGIDICVTIMCRNDELNWTMSWVGCLLKDSELFILFPANSQILLKISVIPILLIFMYLVVLNLLVNNQLNSSANSPHRRTQLIIVAHNCHICLFNYHYQITCGCWNSGDKSWGWQHFPLNFLRNCLVCLDLRR